MITINNMCYFYTEHTEWQYYTFLSSPTDQNILSVRLKQPRKYLKSASLLETVMITYYALLCIACILEFLLVDICLNCIRAGWVFVCKVPR